MKPGLILLFIAFSYCAFSQKIFIKGEETDRKLTWSDFTGKIDRNSSFLAYTGYLIKPRAENIRALDDSISIGKFEVILELDPVKSWAKTDRVTDELLVHEQGHFDIGILCMRELLAVYAQTRFTKTNVNETLQNITTNAQKKYREMGLKYDEETDHSKNKEQQAKWSLFLAEELKK